MNNSRKWIFRGCAVLAGLPQEAWMTEFVSAPEPVTEEDEFSPADEEIMLIGDF